MRNLIRRTLPLVCIMGWVQGLIAQSNTTSFSWPDGKKVAVSLTFDDARPSQVAVGTELLDRYGVKATFYVLPGPVKEHLNGWKRAAAKGHEIGNHSLNHPCSGNFLWAREKALENFTMDEMRSELVEANNQIEAMLGAKPTAFAYPCGQTFIGRGSATKSYIPLVADIFASGRGWLDEGPNDPSFCDFAQLTGMEMDGKDFDEILSLIKAAEKDGLWLVLAGHEMGTSGPQTTKLEMLEKLIAYAQDPAHNVWLAPVGTIGTYVEKHRR